MIKATLVITVAILAAVGCMDRENYKGANTTDINKNVVVSSPFNETQAPAKVQTSTAKAEYTLSKEQLRWLSVYNNQIQQFKFAAEVGNNSKVCQTMAIAKEAAFQIGDQDFYKSHVQLMRDVQAKGAYCPEWNWTN